MGCTTSRQARHDLRHCPSPLALPRCQSFPARCAGDAGVHVVRLTSTTLGSLEVDKGARAAEAPPMRRMVPRTPTMTPPNEAEAIDAWALRPASRSTRRSWSRRSRATPSRSRSRRCPGARRCVAQGHAAAAGGEEEGVAGGASAQGRALLHVAPRRARDARGLLPGARHPRGYGVRVDERDVSMHRDSATSSTACSASAVAPPSPSAGRRRRRPPCRACSWTASSWATPTS